MAIKTEERSRSLVCTFGEGDDALEFIIKPVNSSVGAVFVSTLVGSIASALLEDAEAAKGPVDTELAELVLGEHLERGSEELRDEEFNELFYAAFFWNAKGGGYSYVKRAEANGVPKVLREFLDKWISLGQTQQTIKSQS